MAKKHEKILTLEDKTCRMGKISNNLEKHGDEWKTAFTIPISGIMLTEPELNAFMSDKYCHRSWFESKGSVDHPCAWWGEEEFTVTPQYEAEALTITVGGKELEFEAEEPEDPDDEDDKGLPACTLSRITLKPLQGGQTEMRFSLYLRPGVGKTNLLLQEHQHHTISLTLTDAKAAREKEGKQAPLPLGPASGAGNNGGDRPEAAK
jgi:hypothetical protein